MALALDMVKKNLQRALGYARQTNSCSAARNHAALCCVDRSSTLRCRLQAYGQCRNWSCFAPCWRGGIPQLFPSSQNRLQSTGQLNRILQHCALRRRTSLLLAFCRTCGLPPYVGAHDFQWSWGLERSPWDPNWVKKRAPTL